MGTENAAGTPSWTEADRLAALHRYDILDTKPEQAFDDIVDLAVELLQVPIAAAVNLIEKNRQWFKAEIGLGVRETALDVSICAEALLEEERLIVPDASADSRFSCNPLVSGAPGLRFYAGELLRTPDGYPLGTLCVLDVKPRPHGLTLKQQSVLQALARQVMTQLELRRTVREQEKLLLQREQIEHALRAERDRSRQLLEGMDEGS